MPGLVLPRSVLGNGAPSQEHSKLLPVAQSCELSTKRQLYGVDKTVAERCIGSPPSSKAGCGSFPFSLTGQNMAGQLPKTDRPNRAEAGWGFVRFTDRPSLFAVTNGPGSASFQLTHHPLKRPRPPGEVVSFFAPGAYLTPQRVAIYLASLQSRPASVWDCQAPEQQRRQSPEGWFPFLPGVHSPALSLGGCRRKTRRSNKDARAELSAPARAERKSRIQSA